MPLLTAHLQRELTPTPTGNEASRAFFQSRVSLLFAVLSANSVLFFVFHNWLEVQANHVQLGEVLTLPLNRWHLGAAGLGALLALGSRALRLEIRALSWIEGAGTVAVLTTHDMMALPMLGVPAPHFDLVLTMIYVLYQLTRTVIIPSSARRTLAVCAISAVPLVLMAWQLAVTAPDAWSNARTSYAPLYIALWCFSAAIPATLGSSVIYGLRQQVRKTSQLGQYTLEERLGEGGMGTVYRARHAMLRRPTAVKLLRPERTGAQALERFEREVQMTSELTHPNTVAIYDYGRTADGVFYYAMEYLDGLDLQRLVEVHGPQPSARVAQILTQVCRALGEAHHRGLVHRDIKPANIIMCERGGVPDIAKVVDFGLVKSLLSGAQTDPALSAAQTIIGTPHYLAPESIRDAQLVDPRSDLYALGAVGYWLLSGLHVFEGPGVLEVCSQHLHALPILPSQRSGRSCDRGLEQLIMRCLSKDPADRPQSADELGDALTALGLERDWTTARAQRWWTEWRARSPDEVAAPHSSSTRELELSPTLFEVDVQARARPS